MSAVLAGLGSRSIQRGSSESPSMTAEPELRETDSTPGTAAMASRSWRKAARVPSRDEPRGLAEARLKVRTL